MIRGAFACLALLAVVGCTSSGVGSHSLSVVESRGGHSANPSATLGNRTPAGGATTAAAAGQWPVPDQRLTPGAVTTTMIINGNTVPCTPSRPQSQRDVTDAEKRATAIKYRVPFTVVKGHAKFPPGLEFDHRVPFALCGSNGPLNVWPEPKDDRTLNCIARGCVLNRKDQLEDVVIRLVKAGRLTLMQGQAIFLGDWRTGYCQYVRPINGAC